jgi:hypothetical protein
VSTTASRTKVLLGLGAVAVAAFGLFWFQPHKLFIDERVSDTIPVVEPTVPDTTAPDPGDETDAPPPTTEAPAEPVVLASGDFVSLDHGTTGVVRVLGLADGSRIVRLEGLDTDNGPDLYLYLSTSPADGAEGGFDDDIANLGRLLGNQGDQNYDLPADVDLGRFASVVIWCDRFDSAFGAANLAAG